MEADSISNLIKNVYKYGQKKLSVEIKYKSENELSNSPTLKLLLILKQMTIPMYSFSSSQSFFFINSCNHSIKFPRLNQNTHGNQAITK